MIKRTIYLREAIDNQLLSVATAQNKSISGVVHEALIATIAGAYAGTPEAAPLDDDAIFGKGKHDRN